MASDYYENRLLPALNHIRDHLDQSLQLEQLAEVAHFSKYHFHRVFKAIYGETVHGHVRRLRLERALQFLRTRPGLSILDVAAATGYSSQATFTRDFKRHFGMTPGKVRQLAGDQCPSSFQPSQPISEPNQLEGQVRLERVPSQHLVYKTRHGRYDFRLGLVWIRLITKAHALGLLNRDSRKIGIFYDDPAITPAKRCRFDVCITVDDSGANPEGLSSRRLAEQTCAVFDYADDFRRLDATMDAFYSQWLVRSHHEPADAPPFMRFEGSLHDYKSFSVCVPVESFGRSTGDGTI